MNSETKTGVPHWAGDALVGVVLALGGFVFASLSWPIPRGEIGNPGPGFLPLVLGLALVVLGASCTMRAWRARDAATVTLAERKAVICVLALFGAALLFVPFGFLPTMAIFLAVLFAALAHLRWWVAALSGAGASVAVWFVFDRLLALTLPAGVMAVF